MGRGLFNPLYKKKVILCHLSTHPREFQWCCSTLSCHIIARLVMSHDSIIANIAPSGGFDCVAHVGKLSQSTHGLSYNNIHYTIINYLFTIIYIHLSSNLAWFGMDSILALTLWAEPVKRQRQVCSNLVMLTTLTKDHGKWSDIKDLELEVRKHYSDRAFTRQNLNIV